MITFYQVILAFHCRQGLQVLVLIILPVFVMNYMVRV
jgi:hypothetical protein